MPWKHSQLYITPMLNSPLWRSTMLECILANWKRPFRNALFWLFYVRPVLIFCICLAVDSLFCRRSSSIQPSLWAKSLRRLEYEVFNLLSLGCRTLSHLFVDDENWSRWKTIRLVFEAMLLVTYYLSRVSARRLYFGKSIRYSEIHRPFSCAE